jgi:hypothetical protein
MQHERFARAADSHNGAAIDPPMRHNADIDRPTIGDGVNLTGHGLLAASEDPSQYGDNIANAALVLIHRSHAALNSKTVATHRPRNRLIRCCQSSPKPDVFSFF